MQPADGGRRRIFIRQQALAHADALGRSAHGRRVFGLLLGRLHRCPLTSTDYFVIESVAEQEPVTDDGELEKGVAQALRRRADDKDARVLGWYRSVSRVELKPSPSTAAIHATFFSQPWHTTLVVADSSSAPGGAFFLNDAANRRWFYAPFYELSDLAPTSDHAKTTCIAWPQYMTAEAVALVAREPAPTPSADVRVARPDPDRVTDLPSLGETDARGAKGRAAPRARPAAPFRRSRAAQESAPGAAAGGDTPGLAHPPSLTVPSNGVAPIPEKPTGRSRARFFDRPVERRPVADERDQQRAGRGLAHRVSDEDDTTPRDTPARYIELARADGFFIAANFAAAGAPGQPESLWVLNEPYSGFLLMVVTTDAEVVDATLHYNLHTDDADELGASFPEHRDPESRTIYRRETCVEGLRARCRRLRAMNALEREWKVSPAISFLTPGEWQSIAMAGGEGEGGELGTRSNDRIAELPDGVRMQFRLAARGRKPA